MSLPADTGPLPVWARMMAKTMPKTTAAMLQLDFAQRTKSPLDARLVAAMRYMAARANGCGYAEAYALADARRVGLERVRLESLVSGELGSWSEPERAALEFARKMAVASSTVTDGEFAALVNAYGERGAAAMVLHSAYANFQDRLLICLGAEVEEGGPLSPVEVVVAPQPRGSRPSGSRVKVEETLGRPGGGDEIADDARWVEMTYEALQERLDKQRKRATRLPVPAWAEVEKKLPAGFMKPTKIVWYQVTMGYVPELAVPFEQVLRTGGSEFASKYDRIFGGSLFWVVTKAIDCPYCMGHCEMNWEVAGLSAEQIAERSRQLSGDDWSSFPPAQRRAFAFARKLTQAPSLVGDGDIEALRSDFGPEVALIVAFSAARYNYMTRISNGFQLTLESENVFFDYHGVSADRAGAVGSRGRPWAPILSNEECWKRLPKAERGEGGELPLWARAMAGQLPRTAAAMLELDYAQRVRSPLDPVLRAKMRWVIAHANRCELTAVEALGDLKRVGADAGVVAALTAGPGSWPSEDREPLEFARLLTVAAPTITDGLFASLRERFGEKRVAAMVLLGAYGNFQDRIVLGLGLTPDASGGSPPLDVKFAPGAIQMTPIPLVKRALPELVRDGSTVVGIDSEWSKVTYDEWQSRLEQQRAKPGRLLIPSWDEVKKNLPPALAQRPIRIVWTLLCLGYVPELALPWNNATRTVWAEVESDKLLEESLFWIQTRAIECNYCMGHCEMLMEVAGLNKEQIAERTRLLAGGDWSAFPPREQRAFAFAAKLSKTPWEMSGSDYEALVSDYGPQRGMAIFWWLCRGLYMTRVSDGFQLPLERENVFSNFYPTGSEPKAESSSAPKD
jgi:alkylhydroperoxidase family enzyme